MLSGERVSGWPRMPLITDYWGSVATREVMDGFRIEPRRLRQELARVTGCTRHRDGPHLAAVSHAPPPHNIEQFGSAG